MNEAVDRWEDKQEIMVHSLLLNELELHLGSDVPKGSSSPNPELEEEKDIRDTFSLR